MAYSSSDWPTLTFSTGYRTSSTINPHKWSWIAGLPNCPKCKAKNEGWLFYCDECNYGERLSKTRKPTTKIKGYTYIVDKDNPHGKYFKDANKDLFKTVIMEDYKKQMILEALSMVENHDLIFNKWGFNETMEKGTGTSLLFHGPPGTGKTLMGQAIADYLGKNLTVITAAEILSKWVGEAEQNTAKIFDDNKNNVILFDECDSLLQSRSTSRASWEVSQVNVLLNKLENHQGVTIFTTNYTSNIDEALDRRIALKVHFEMPSQELRIDIWKRMFPNNAPLSEDIDWSLLASFDIAGGHIKNAVLRSARIAAFRKMNTISFDIIKEGLKQELASQEEYNNPKKKSTSNSKIVGKDMK